MNKVLGVAAASSTAGYVVKNVLKNLSAKLKKDNMCDSLVLKKEFPMSIPFVKHIPDTDRYYFKAMVQSFQAPGRFVLGLMEDVQVVGSKEFIRYINRIVKKNR